LLDKYVKYSYISNIITNHEKVIATCPKQAKVLKQ